MTALPAIMAGGLPDEIFLLWPSISEALMKSINQVLILAAAIRSQARRAGYDPRKLTLAQILDFFEADAKEQNSIAGQFYLTCSDTEWQQVCQEVWR